MRTPAIVAILLVAGPAHAELTRPQCRILSSAMGNTVAVLDKMRGTLDRQAFADIAKGSPAELRSAAERAQASRDRFGLALSAYASSLEDFQAQLDACARR